MPVCRIRQHSCSYSGTCSERTCNTILHIYTIYCSSIAHFFTFSLFHFVTQVSGLSQSILNPASAVALTCSVYLWELIYGFDQEKYGELNYNLSGLWVSSKRLRS